MKNPVCKNILMTYEIMTDCRKLFFFAKIFDISRNFVKIYESSSKYTKFRDFSYHCLFILIKGKPRSAAVSVHSELFLIFSQKGNEHFRFDRTLKVPPL
jgi:hypothetical protein